MSKARKEKLFPVTLDFLPEEWDILERALVRFGARRRGSDLVNAEEALMRLLRAASSGGPSTTGSRGGGQSKATEGPLPANCINLKEALHRAAPETATSRRTSPRGKKKP